MITDKSTCLLKSIVEILYDCLITQYNLSGISNFYIEL